MDKLANSSQFPSPCIACKQCGAAMDVTEHTLVLSSVNPLSSSSSRQELRSSQVFKTNLAENKWLNTKDLYRKMKPRYTGKPKTMLTKKSAETRELLNQRHRVCILPKSQPRISKVRTYQRRVRLLETEVTGSKGTQQLKVVGSLKNYKG